MEVTDLVEVIKYLEVYDKSPSYATIREFRLSVVRKSLLQFDRLTLIKGVLHQTFAQVEAKFHKLVLHSELRPEVLKMLHDDQGHHAIKRTLSLLVNVFTGVQCMHMLPAGSRTVIGVK